MKTYPSFVWKTIWILVFICTVILILYRLDVMTNMCMRDAAAIWNHVGLVALLIWFKKNKWL